LSVKSLIGDRHSRYLVLQRSRSSKNHPGLWDFPGGKTDPGELFDQAVLRETREETSLNVKLCRVLGAGESEMPERKIVYLFMEAQVLGNAEVRLSEEHDSFAWLTPSELAAVELCPQFRSFATQFASNRSEHV
jgi:8-oxo-dGTP pyrophosphatase MutT (NUDIX family)